MTVTYAGSGLWTGLSTDTKPTPPSSGYRFFETDTGDTLLSDGTYWWLVGQPSMLSTRRIGRLSYGPTATSIPIGMLNSPTAATGAGSQSFVTTDVTNGTYYSLVTGATLGNNGGYRGGNTIAIRQWNPQIYMKFQLLNNLNMRMYFGLLGGTPADPSGDTPLSAGIPAVLFGMTSSATAPNYSVYHNDTTASTVVDSTTIATDITTVHTLKMVADNANTRFAWSFDNGAYNFITTRIPSASNILTFCFELQTAEAVAKQINLYEFSIQTDR